jgi:hypothetical protein
VLIGLFAFGLVCLKTTYLVPAAAIAGAFYGTMLWRERQAGVAGEALAAGLATLAFSLPWALISLREAGTLLFPFTGAGRLSPLQGTDAASLADFVKSGGRTAVLLLFPALVGLGLLRERTPAPERLFTGAALLLCSLLLVLAQAKYAVSGYRYGYAAAAGLFLFALPLWLGERRFPGPRWVLALAPAVMLSVALYAILRPGYGADTYRGGILYRWAAGAVPVSPAGPARESKAAVRAAQAAVPPGATLLARIDHPYLLDFRRNRVFVADWPGLTGPSPPPHSADPSAWADYLRRHGIAFVAWSWRSEAGMGAAYLQPLIAQSDSAFFKDQLGRTVLTQQALAAMHGREPAAYDDGAIRVHDLRAATP